MVDKYQVVAIKKCGCEHTADFNSITEAKIYKASCENSVQYCDVFICINEGEAYV